MDYLYQIYLVPVYFQGYSECISYTIIYIYNDFNFKTMSYMNCWIFLIQFTQMYIQWKIHNILFLIYEPTIRYTLYTYMNGPPGYTRHIRILYTVYFFFQKNAYKINLAVYFLVLFRIFHFEIIIRLVYIGYVYSWQIYKHVRCAILSSKKNRRYVYSIFELFQFV